MKISKLSLAVIVSLYFSPLYSQEIYDLNRCITTGLERNFSILVARNKEEIAANNYTTGNAGFLPTLDMSSRYAGSLNNTKQTLSAGGENTINGIYNTSGSAGINLGWTIFQGFIVRTTYKKLDELKKLGELSTQMAVENLVADIVADYYLYIQQLRLYNNLGYAVSLSKERVRIDEERYLLGSSSKLQLLQSIVYLNADSSRLSKQNEVLNAQQVRLNKLMAMEDLGENIILKDSMITIQTDLLYDQLLDNTISSNTSLQMASRNQAISEYDYKIIASRTYPYLNFSSGYNYSFNTYRTGTYKNQQTNGMNYGVTMGIDIFDGFNQRREKNNASIEIENKQHQYKEIEQQIRADLITIYYAYRNNLGLLKLEMQNLETAKENLAIAVERYKLGNLSGLDLREVQKSLLDAEERLLSIQYQTKIAEISLLQISGRIMEYL